MNDLRQQFYEMLMESQYWSEAQLIAYQCSQLEQLLRHARKNVPFYEHRLDAVFTPSGDIDWDRWSEIPIVKRSDMVEHREAMQAQEMPKGHGRWSTITSSGSSGLPIEITVNRLTSTANDCNRWRAHRWHGLDWSKTYTARHGLEANADWPNGRAIGPWGPPWIADTQSGRGLVLSRSASMEQTLEFLQRTGSSYLSGGPKTTHVMGLEAKRLGLEVQLDCVLTHGEGASLEDRAAIAQIFGARVLELYSSKEAGQIAYSCATGHGLHVSSESVLLEVLGEDRLPCAPGESGRVVVTPFFSTAQPLIRYEQGDLARFGPLCSCGRALPLLEAVEGRTTVVFTHPDGRSINRLLVEDAREALRCSFWQIAQVGPLQFEVRYVPQDETAPADETTAEAIFKANYFEDAEVLFVRTERIPLSSAGKHLEYVLEWQRPS